MMKAVVQHVSFPKGKRVVAVSDIHGSCDAVKKLLEQVEQGRLSAAEIDEQRIAAELDTAGLPDPDLMIRTSGEQRISNFMLWQLAYAEFYYTCVPWPDFDKAELEKAVLAYNNRDRRFGLVKEEG